MDCPSEVLPTPGGPTRQRIGAPPLVVRLQLQHRKKFKNPLLDVLEPVMIGIKHLFGLGAVEPGPR